MSRYPGATVAGVLMMSLEGLCVAVFFQGTLSAFQHE